MTARILVIETKTIGEKPLTRLTEYIPGEEGTTIDHKQEATRKRLDWRYGSGDLTTTFSMVNPFIAHYQSTSPVGSAEVARHLGVLPEPMDYLQCQWENAEVPTKGNPTREGDVVIEKSNDHDFGVFEATKSLVGISVGVRILSRAPQREPWQALADVLGDVLIGTPEDIARALYGKGVRVTGGDRR